MTTGDWIVVGMVVTGVVLLVAWFIATMGDGVRLDTDDQKQFDKSQDGKYDDPDTDN